MNELPTAYLIAYTNQGVMEYRTTNYEEVYKFKATCKKINCPYAVRFRKATTTSDYVNNGNPIVRAAKSFIHWFALR